MLASPRNNLSNLFSNPKFFDISYVVEPVTMLRTDLIKYKDFEIELQYVDTDGLQPTSFRVRRMAPEGMEKYGKFIVNETDGGFSGQVYATTKIWFTSYTNTMSLEEFFTKTVL